MNSKKSTNDEALEAAKSLFISGGLMAEEAEFKNLDNDYPRFTDSIDAEKNDKRTSGYIIIYQNDDSDYVRIIGKSWHDELPELVWSADGLSSIIDDTERVAYLAKLEENRKNLQDQREQQFIENRQLLADTLNQFPQAQSNHLYLQNKKALAHPGTLINYQCEIVLPLTIFNSDELITAQRIAPDGSKRFYPNCGKKGGCFEIKGKSGITLVAEGYATADAVFQATGYSTVMAVDCGNLDPVVRSIRKAKPKERIIIVADNDKYGEPGKNPGVEAARDIVNSSTQVSIFIPRFTNEATKPTDANDLLVLEGINELARQLNVSISLASMGLPINFTYNGSWLFVTKKNDDGKEYETYVCSNFYPKAISRDKSNQNWSKVFELIDPDEYKHTVTIPMEFISKDSAATLAPLLSSGLRYNRKATQDLIDFIQNAEPLQRARNVNQVGWYGDSYVFPDHSIGKSNEPVIYQSTGILPSGYEVSGTLEEWQNNVSKHCIDNSRLILMLCAAFSGPLIELIPSLESGGFHIRCESSRGKSTALRVCKSVWGDPSQLVTWRATSNGLEGIAFMHNDSVLVLDELGQMADENPTEAGQTAYMLSNGASKQRANRTGGSAQLKTWRLIFVSAGEISLSTVMNQAGKMVKGGQEVRFIDIQADAGAGLGLFDTTHEFPGGSEFAQMLNTNTKTYYGTAAREFITQLTADKSEMTRRVTELMTQFESSLSVNNVDGQISRVIKRFALVAAAGQLATEMGITGWSEAQAFDGIKRCFESWFSERPGGSASHESDLAISTVRSRIQEWKEARFIDSNDTMTRHNGPTWGVIHQNDFLIYPKNFRNDICEGLDYRTVAAVLAEKGFLVPDSDGKAKSIVVRLPRKGGQRFYRIKAELLMEDEPAAPYTDPDALVVPSFKADDDEVDDTEVKAGVDNSYPYTV